MTRAITYGTFDLMHVGHILLLKSIKSKADYLVVGLSTDEFNQSKGKQAKQSYELRKAVLESTDLVNEVIPESSWEQKETDIVKHEIDIFIMGDDWSNKFNHLPCKVEYLPRTKNISSTWLKELLE